MLKLAKKCLHAIVSWHIVALSLVSLLAKPIHAEPIAHTSNAAASGVAFAGKTEVTVKELLVAIEALVPEFSKAKAVQSDYQALIRQFALQPSAQLYADYVRVRIAFEATRAGGWWGNAWTITDQAPQSDLIWRQWQAAGAAPTATTALAECDELSALVAVVAHGIGLSKQSEIGMLWPTANHTVAVWVIREPSCGNCRANGKPAVRVVLPTSQIFLDPAQSIGTTSFDPWKQKTIYDYRRKDVALDAKLPAGLARYFVDQIKLHAEFSQVQLQALRNQREQRQRQQ
jgi:hypothetical protein